MKLYVSGQAMKANLRAAGFDVISARQKDGKWTIFVDPKPGEEPEVTAKACALRVRVHILEDMDAHVKVRTRGFETEY
jgi:hypothetical protein